MKTQSKKDIYNTLKVEDYYKNLFEVDFEFDELSKIEKSILKETIKKIDENTLEFNLSLVENVIQPLNILVRLFKNKTTGDVAIKTHDKEGTINSIILFKTVKIMKINDFIDFDYNADTNMGYGSGKNIKVDIIYDDILYSSDNKEFDKLT